MLAASLLAMLSLAPLTAHGQQKAAKAKDKGAPYPRQLALFDRQGKSLGTVGEPDNFMNLFFRLTERRLRWFGRAPGV